MDRYQRVEKPRPETPINENEIRITTQGKMRNYITYATTLLQDKGASEIVLKAMGRAINKTVTIAEIIKRRIAGLHQNTSIGSTDITDLWQPLEEGLLPLETTRHVSMITITLSTKELDKTSTGYQPPLPADQVKPLAEFEYEGGGNGTPTGEYNGVDAGWGRGRGRIRGRGRARGFRGRGRGFGGSDQQEAGGYDDVGAGGAETAPRGRGDSTEGTAAMKTLGGRGRGKVRGRGRGRGFRTDGPMQGAGGAGAM